MITIVSIHQNDDTQNNWNIINNLVFDLIGDGRRVLTIENARTESSLPSYVLRVVINWVDELRESSG